MTPKIIHYCWLNKTLIKPEIVEAAIHTWKKVLADYEIKLWDRESIKEFNIPNIEKYIEAGSNSYSYAVDLIKLYALYKYGGIYLDADCRVNKSFDGLLNNNLFVGNKSPKNGCLGYEIIGAEKNCTTIVDLISSYTKLNYIGEDGSINKYNPYEVFNKTMLNSIATPWKPIDEIQHIKSLTIYPQSYFYSETGGYCNLSGYSSRINTVSVVMPVYNSEKYIKEAIESVLAQTFNDFEFIIVNDGSTDNSESIIKSYLDDRIYYIKKEHSGIADSLNLGIKHSTGMFIARMDADDIMYPERLEKQVALMLRNKDIDLLGTGFEYIKNGEKSKQYFSVPQTCPTMEMFIKGQNIVAHPTVMMRAESLKKLPFLYEQYYNGVEDLKLWMTMLSRGLKMWVIPTILHGYRIHDNQTQRTEWEMPDRVVDAYNSSNEGDLTVIIPFRNEGYEVEKTVASVRGTARVHIILVDDSDPKDAYDYKWIADTFKCDYYKTSGGIGAAAAKQFGVDHCKTPYFVLLDAHMRFYEFNWDKRITDLLKENPDRIVSANSIVITRDKYGVYNNEDGVVGRHTFGSYGAWVNTKEAGWEFTAKWNAIDPDKEHSIIQIPCVMGAVYASTVTFWNRIGGYRGLKLWGQEEPFISIKAWLAGGEVLLIKDWGVGHLYRNSAPYSSPVQALPRNQIFVYNFLADPKDIFTYNKNLKNKVGEQVFNNAMSDFIRDCAEYKQLKDEFEKQRKYPLSYFLEINSRVTPPY